MSSFDLLCRVLADMANLPLRLAQHQIHLRDAQTGVILATSVSHLLWVLNGHVTTVEASTLVDAYHALDSAKTACVVALATGEGFQGPVAKTEDDRLWAITGVEVNPDSRWPVILEGNATKGAPA